MPQVKNILVPVEIHENAVPVVTWARLMAQATESRLTLLHVNESLEPLKTRPAFPGGGGPEATATVEEWRSAYDQIARLDLARLAERFCAGVPVDTVLLEGRAHRTILTYLKNTPYDLVVMGTHGKPWYQRLLLGSTAEAVLRASSLPVLIVHNTAAAPRPPQLKTLLLPTDFSDCSTAGEEWAAYLAGYGAEQVILVHVVENPLLEAYEPDKVEIDLRRIMEESRQHPPRSAQPFHDLYVLSNNNFLSASRQHPPRSAQPFWEHAHRVATEKLTRLRQQFPGAPLQVELLTRDGLVAEEILALAEGKHSDLIVMATHGRTGVRHLLLGSVTEKVVRATSCPVLAVRRGE